MKDNKHKGERAEQKKQNKTINVCYEGEHN